MTDREAILSIINCYFNVCSNNYGKEDNGIGITPCTFCRYKELESVLDYLCWQHKIADNILEVIPQLDIYNVNKSECKSSPLNNVTKEINEKTEKQINDILNVKE